MAVSSPMMRWPLLRARRPRPRHAANFKEMLMEDLMWLGFIVGLLAVTLIYVRLCDNA